MRDASAGLYSRPMALDINPQKLKSPLRRGVLPDPFYYLNNFQTVLSSLETRYTELLSPEERQFIGSFRTLAHLRLWFEWILRDVQENRAGFPDLVQFWPRERRYRLVEVKGPGDQLRDNQRRLLEYCVSHNMPVSVCRVRWAPS